MHPLTSKGDIVSKLESFATPEQSSLCSSSFAKRHARLTVRLWRLLKSPTPIMAVAVATNFLRAREFNSHRRNAENIFFMKTPLESEHLRVGHQWCFCYKSCIYAAFQGRIFFLLFGLKIRKVRNLERKSL